MAVQYIAPCRIRAIIRYCCPIHRQSRYISFLISLPDIINYIFSFTFTVDLLFKLYGVGPVEYFIKRRSFYQIISKIAEGVVSYNQVSIETCTFRTSNSHSSYSHCYDVMLYLGHAAGNTECHIPGCIPCCPQRGET